MYLSHNKVNNFEIFPNVEIRQMEGIVIGIYKSSGLLREHSVKRHRFEVMRVIKNSPKINCMF
jgi:hypothetical protein